MLDECQKCEVSRVDGRRRERQNERRIAGVQYRMRERQNRFNSKSIKYY